MRYLITGGSTGLGKAIVDQLSSDSQNHIVYTYNKTNPHVLKENVSSFQVDFTDSNSYLSFLEQISELNIDVLINNYHTGYTQKHIYKFTETDLLSSFHQNIAHTIGLSKLFIEKFRKNKSGVLITVLSEYVNTAPPTGLSVYVAEKQYLKAFTEAWHNELASKNIFSIAISPKFMKTPFNKNLPDFIVEEISKKGALTTPEIVASKIIAVSKEPHLWSGQNIII